MKQLKPIGVRINPTFFEQKLKEREKQEAQATSAADQKKSDSPNKEKGSSKEG